MSLTAYITRIEIMDGEELAAKLETIDSVAASVTINTAFNSSSWRELSSSIYAALQSMKLEGDL